MTMNYIIPIYLSIIIISLSCSGHFQTHPEMREDRPPHHTAKGFMNPFPGFEEKGFGDFLYWILIDRAKNSRDKNHQNYRFEIIDNDGSSLRENSSKSSVTWIGHSTLLIQIEGVNILTDPIWSERSSPFQFIGPRRFVPPGIQLEDLPEIHAVIISHDHYDHLDEATIKAIGNKPLYIVPLKVGKLLENFGITNYRELDWWQSTEFKEIEFISTPAQHFSGRSFLSRNTTLWTSWVIKGRTHRIYFTGDSGYFNGFKEIGERYGPFDLAAIPIGAYMPRWFMGPVHISPAEAVQVYLDLRARTFIAIHWGTFDLANEPLDDPPKVLLNEIIKRSLLIENFWIFRHGETRFLNHLEQDLQKGL
jgi:N-acyl-phosphatidylethanolamine-hydrolysing phospholipase D